MIRLSAGQSVCGGPLNWHKDASGIRALWCVSGCLEYPDTPDGRAEALAAAAKIRSTGQYAEPYGGSLGTWAPPPHHQRLSQYSPR